ncbi:MAG TPA: response regulator [Thioploca sp.]|nr:response regulator [Thioploca sp.]
MKTFFQILAGIIMLIIFISAQGDDIKFEHLNVEDGLPSNFTTSVIQDDQGFMWFATKNGLAKYDGIKFIVYKYDPDNILSLSNNYTWFLLKDRTGNLWIATSGGGLNKFDPKTEIFTRYQHDPNDPNSLISDNIQSIYEDNDGTIWVLIYANGFSKFDPSNNSFINYRHDPNNTNSLSNNTTYSISQGDNDILWISTYGGGLNKFDIKTETFTHYRHDETNPNSLANDSMRTILVDKSGILWLATESGLDKYDPNTEKFIHYQHDKYNPNSLSHNMVTSIYEDSKGKLWIGTLGGGLNQFDRNNDKFTHYQAELSNPYSLSNNTIFGIYENNTGIIWITTDNGINKYDPGYDRFITYEHKPLQKNGLNNNLISAIYENNNILWIGTKGGGLNKLDRTTSSFTNYRYDNKNPNSISNNLIMTIHPDNNGKLWIATEGGGLNYFNPKTEIFTHYQHDPNNSNSINYDVIWDIDLDNEGNVWIASIGGGLDKLDPIQQTVKHYKHDKNDPNSIVTDWLSVVKVDSTGIIWIGADDSGIITFDPTTQIFTNYIPNENPNSISNAVISTIFEDKAGTIWIGTNDGLNKFNKAEQNFTTYQVKHGLIGNSVAGILEDNQGYLWISTNNGLSRFNPKTKTFRNYDKRDGLQGNLFLPRSAYKNMAGELFFGGLNGFNTFYPDKLQDNPYPPPVILTDFQLFNQSVLVNKTSPLQVPINFAKQIILSYEQSVFSFEFVALNYQASNKNKYAYMMEGFDKEWTYTNSNRRFATYTNLDAGKYNFTVKASNNDGLWNEIGTSIEVIILPPWWQTWWAYTIYTIVILGGIIGVFVAQQRKLEFTRAFNARLQNLNEQLQTANKLKDEFLANTSHELRTPLNGIIGIAESLIDGVTGKLPDKTIANLDMIVSSGKRLANLVNDILDFSTLKQKKLDLQLKPIALHEIIEIVFNLNQTLVQDKNLKLLNNVAKDLPPIQADENRLQQIFYNLLGNAIKFTEVGKIEITAKAIDSYIEITVSDTGIGIPSDKLESIFGSFEQGEGSTAREYGGTGLGLAVTKQLIELHNGKIWAKSIFGKGSQLIFTLPIAKGKASPLSTEIAHVSKVESYPANSTEKEDKPEFSVRKSKKIGSNVLIVDDEPINLQVLENYLSLENHNITQANSGIKALELIQNGLKPDAILLDVMMPKMSGYEVTTQIRKTWQADELPILLLTAKNQITDLVTGLDVGANDYLTKPILKDELLARLKTHLKIKKLQVETVRLAAIEAVNKMMVDSIRYAKTIQSSLLPNPEQISNILPKHFFTWMPRDIVGGDIIYAEPFNNTLIIVVMDCTGHGVPGAFMAMVASTSLRRITRDESCHDPSKILQKLSFSVKTALQQDTEHVESDDGLDAAVCLINFQNMILTFAGARLPLNYIKNNEIYIIKGDKESLGYKKAKVDFPFTSHKVPIETDMFFYISTDGFTDQLGGKKNFPLGNKRFQDILLKIHHYDFSIQQKELFKLFDEYKGDNNQQDDITIVGFGL